MDSTSQLWRAAEGISVIHQFHDGVWACVRLDDGGYSGWLPVERSLRQGCVLELLLVTTFFAEVIHVAFTPNKSDKDIMVNLTRETLPGNGGMDGSNSWRTSPGGVTHYGACYKLTMLVSFRNRLSSSGK